MIFVTIGTSEPFDRLMRALETLSVDEDVIAQIGASQCAPAGTTCVSFLPFEELVDYARRARAIVSHAGAGTVMTCLAVGKRPIVVPRLRRFGETSDDHQLAFGRRLHAAGLVTLVEDVERLNEALRDAPAVIPARSEPTEGLARDLRTYLVEVAGPGSSTRA